MADLTRRQLFGAAAGLPLLLTSPSPAVPELRQQPGLAQAITPPRIVKAPGKDFAVSVRRFVAELRNRYRTKTPYPISRAFQTLPFNVIKDGVAEKLIARGSLTFQGTTGKNTGDYVEAEFGDRTFGNMTIVFDETVSATFSEPDPESLQIDFGSTPAVVMFHNIDPSYRVASNQRVQRVLFQPNVVKYYLFEALDSSRRTELHVDLTATNIPVAQVAALRLADSGFALEEAQPICKCKCCGEEVCSPACPPPKGSGKTQGPPSYSDLVADRCIYLNRLNRYTAFITGNVFGITSDYTAKEYIGKVITVRNGWDCHDNDLYGKAVGSAALRVLEITYNEVYPPNSPTVKSTMIYGAPA